jgi:hypothetical protein
LPISTPGLPTSFDFFGINNTDSRDSTASV